MKHNTHVKRSMSVGILLLMAASVGLTVAPHALAQPPVPDRSEISVTSLSFNDADEDDFAPQYVYSGSVLFFTSTRSGEDFGDGDQRIWYVPRTGGNSWGTPVATGEALRQAEHVGSAAISPDGNYMVFAAYEWKGKSKTLKGEGRTDLYSAEKRNGEWTNVQNLGAVINSKEWDSQPAMSSDGQRLFFASDREGGLGGTDIYMARRSATGWSAPINLGPVINTPENEMAPRVLPDGSRLFFSSNGHGGAGGYDIFVTNKSLATGADWTMIENIGRPINSESDEFYFESEPNSKNGFFSSNREGQFDIYLAYPSPYPPDAQVVVVGKVLDEKSRQPLEASVTVSDLETGEEVAAFRSDDQTGDYTVLLTKGRRYAITAEAPGYVFYSDEYTVPSDLAQGQEIRKDILLREGSTRLLIYFDYDKADLKKESYPDLTRAVEFLKENPDLNVEVAGHTDSVGSAEYNKTLSQKRAETVKNYFIQKGIKASRLSAVGYGEEQPVADNGTDQGRALNRRVEMRILR